MIQANELRIGNLLRLNNPEHRPEEHGKVLKVVGVTEEYPLVQLVHDPNRIMSFGQFWHFIEPIPLDESWLRRAGFATGLLESTRKGDGYHKKILLIGFFDWITQESYELAHCDLMPLNIILKDNVACCGLEEFNIACIKYVHQLQNLFFALTGTELEFSEI